MTEEKTREILESTAACGGDPTLLKAYHELYAKSSTEEGNFFEECSKLSSSALQQKLSEHSEFSILRPISLERSKEKAFKCDMRLAREEAKAML